MLVSYKSNGILQIWKNDELIVDRKGPNVYNNEKSNYFKFGLYKTGWETRTDSPVQTRVIYIDEVRVASGPSASAITVSPPESRPPTNPNVPRSPTKPNVMVDKLATTN
jgi:hypothetical protein